MCCSHRFIKLLSQLCWRKRGGGGGGSVREWVRPKERERERERERIIPHKISPLLCWLCFSCTWVVQRIHAHCNVVHDLPGHWNLAQVSCFSPCLIQFTPQLIHTDKERKERKRDGYREAGGGRRADRERERERERERKETNGERERERERVFREEHELTKHCNRLCSVNEWQHHRLFMMKDGPLFVGPVLVLTEGPTSRSCNWWLSHSICWKCVLSSANPDQWWEVVIWTLTDGHVLSCLGKLKIQSLHS